LGEAPAHARGRAQLARDYAAIMKEPMTRMRAAGRAHSRTDSQIAGAAATDDAPFRVQCGSYRAIAIGRN